MMLQPQVCTLAQAKKLKELGIQQMSINSWVHKGQYWCGTEYNEEKPAFLTDGCSQSLDFPYRFDACAFSVAELGVMLPDLVETNLQYELVCIKDTDCWLCRYCRNNNILDHLPEIKQTAAITEAEARAGMLIQLLEYRYTTPKECNKRLTD